MKWNLMPTQTSTHHERTYSQTPVHDYSRNAFVVVFVFLALKKNFYRVQNVFLSKCLGNTLNHWICAGIEIIICSLIVFFLNPQYIRLLVVLVVLPVQNKLSKFRYINIARSQSRRFKTSNTYTVCINIANENSSN